MKQIKLNVCSSPSHFLEDGSVFFLSRFADLITQASNDTFLYLYGNVIFYFCWTAGETCNDKVRNKKAAIQNEIFYL